MKKEVKIEDFINKEELDAMSEKEREIYEKVFLMNKQNLQGLTNTLDMINEVKDKLENEKMEKLEYIPINIWDDFYDDGYVPEGKKLETYIYVEDTDIPQEKRKEYLEVLLDYINKNLNIEGIKLWMELYESRKKYPNLVGNPEAEKMFFDRWEVRLEGLTHKRLHEWMSILENVDIKVNDIPFHIYSES